MDFIHPLYTEQNDCQDCYKCIRECQIKAITYDKKAARIMHDRCVSCGYCVAICPVGANRLRNDLKRAKELITQDSQIIVSLDSTYISEYPGLAYPKLIAALKQLGFEHISETALGAQELSVHTAAFLAEKKKGIFISSACPSVVELVNKYYPQFNDYLVPFQSPVLVHCKMLKKELGANIKIVYIGNCIAKKREADDHPEMLSLAITFQELNQWFKEKNIDPFSMEIEEKNDFIPEKAREGILYAVSGGIIAGLPNKRNNETIYMNFSGMKNIIKAIDIKGMEMLNQDDLIFLELFASEEGCINGVGGSKVLSSAEKRYEIMNHYDHFKKYIQRNPSINIDRKFTIEPLNLPTATDDQIKSALTFVGMFEKKDEKNCGACGYDSCRLFAGAMLQGNAKPSMCISFMRKVLDKNKQISAELKENLHFHQEIIDAIPVPIFYRTPESVFIGCNKKYEEFAGKSKKEIIGASIFDIQDPKDAETGYKMDQNLVAQPGTQIYEQTIKCLEGTRDVVFNKAVFRNINRTVGGVVGAIFDITERKKFAYELQVAKESAELASELLKQMPSGYVIVNDKLEILESNHSFAKLIGQEAIELYEIIPGLVKADLKQLIPFHDIFTSVMKNNVNILERDIHYNNRVLNISLFSIQQHKVVGAILLDMSDPEVRKDEVISRSRAIIKENLDTVQKIAFLLGENAAKTEDMLSSIIEFYQTKK